MINGIWTLPVPEPGGALMLFVAVNGTPLAAVVRRRPKRI
jgi:hypothetical protein